MGHLHFSRYIITPSHLSSLSCFSTSFDDVFVHVTNSLLLRISFLICLYCFWIGYSSKQQTHQLYAMQRAFRLRLVFRLNGYQSDGGTGLPVAVPLFSLRTIDLSRWTITFSYVGIKCSWLPTCLHYLHQHLYSV